MQRWRAHFVPGMRARRHGGAYALLVAIFAMVYRTDQHVSERSALFPDTASGRRVHVYAQRRRAQGVPARRQPRSVTFSRVVAKVRQHRGGAWLTTHHAGGWGGLRQVQGVQSAPSCPMTFADNRVLWMFSSPADSDTVFQRMTTAVTRSGQRGAPYPQPCRVMSPSAWARCGCIPRWCRPAAQERPVQGRSVQADLPAGRRGVRA